MLLPTDARGEHHKSSDAIAGFDYQGPAQRLRITGEQFFQKVHEALSPERAIGFVLVIAGVVV